MKGGIKNSNHILLCPLLIKYFYYLDCFISRKHRNLLFEINSDIIYILLIELKGNANVF